MSSFEDTASVLKLSDRPSYMVNVPLSPSNVVYEIQQSRKYLGVFVLESLLGKGRNNFIFDSQKEKLAIYTCNRFSSLAIVITIYDCVHRSFTLFPSLMNDF